MDARITGDQNKAGSAYSAEKLMETTVYFDISDLLSFLKASPVVTGIQRVQVEAILALQNENETANRVKCACFGSDFVWRTVSIKAF